MVLLSIKFDFRSVDKVKIQYDESFTAFKINSTVCTIIVERYYVI